MFSLTNRNLGIVFALCAAAGLGAITTHAKIVYADGGNPLTLLLVRFLASSLIFGLLLLCSNQSFKVDRPQRRGVIALGVIWSGSMICYLTAVETISVSLAVLILYAYPMLVLLWSLLRRQTRASPPLIGLFLCAFFGLYLALSGGDIKLDMSGILLASLASIGAAFTFICGAAIAAKMSPLALTFWVNFAGLVMILPFAFDQLAWPNESRGLLALILATLFYLIAVLSQFQALARLPASQAAFILNLEPVVSIVLAMLMLGEVLSLIQASGVLLVISAILFSLRFKTRMT